ncbi:M36 family metallopeptidase [Rubrivirga sp. S365]|uniref:M36 family metallopeptidase n=1 Tax=Rubrivirga sp. S365 TaxID=3076080 RepID=UPI0028C8A0BF|nr:M36 family metallopeptidase [Rubrivirga sp. S365]MDT7855600.1 M36 family metallopeptidase [Rubrivirga sp. S365]
MRLVLLAALVLGPALALAQESPAVAAARGHFREAGARAATDDLADLHPTHVHEDARTGLTFVTLVQRHAGVEVFGTAATAAVSRGGRTHSAPPPFERDLAERAGPSTPALSGAAAVAVAEGVARRALARSAPPGPPALTDDPAVDARAAAEAAARTRAVEAGEPRLGYHEAADGALRLAWEVVVRGVGGAAVLRRVRVDALTGAVLADDDLVVHDAWPAAPTPAPPAASAPPVFLDAGRGGAARAGAYRVVPFPFESPDTDGFALVADPADPAASPLGWHDDGDQTYTVTRGNNVYAYLDADDDDAPDPGSAPDGGPSLTFDFPFSPDAPVRQNGPAAVTNLFYWNNVAHDVAYRYGFDEAAGNFQVTNVTGAGQGDDAVRAEARDGSGSNNANFGTPPEGRPPRMQMFEWRGGAQLRVTAPAALAGPFPSLAAGFGPPVGFSGPLVPTRGPGGETSGCPGQVTGDLTGRVALVERGGCTFVEKVLEAQAAGAVGVVVYNRTGADGGGDVLIVMSGTGDGVVVPSVFVGRSTGLALAGSPAPVAVDVAQLADRLSSFDAGVVVHEYAHGISNRLVGGPSDVGCLSNGATDPDDPAASRPGEQMGEGWSDFYALMLTQRSGDTGRQPRGVGTYLRFEVPDGPGLRPAPYSTDFAVNDYTYADVVSGAAFEPAGARGLSVPHGVGFVWASALWEMTWDLIDTLGFSEDIADASGGAGNQVALNLVTTGLKLTPCTPGFVDGRDAILAADEALYGGAHADLLWNAFARRGLGLDARQGSPENPNDGRAGFVTPSGAGAVALSQTAAVATVRPGASETVEVVLRSARETDDQFAVVIEELPPWVTVEPVAGVLPAGGEVVLRVTLRPSPLDTGRLTATVPVEVDAATRLRLSVRVATDGGVEGTHDLSAVGPNPARTEARFTLAVPATQRVEVALYDRLGRRLRAFAAQLDADTRRSFAVDVGGLASGVYVLRVEGEAFGESRTLTVVR